MIELLGWSASFLFSFCAFPQAYLCYKQGHARGVSAALLIMWGLGELLMQAYVYLKHGLDLPLLINYWVNLIFILIISKYKIWPRFTKDAKPIIIKDTNEK